MKKKIIYVVLFMLAGLFQTSCGGDDVIEPQLVKGIVLSETSITLQLNEEKTLTAIVLPSDAINKQLTWSSSKTSVATVNQSGKVIAKAYGTCTITCFATDGSGVKAECQVIVGGGTGFLSCPDGNHPHAIDLGLPSGTKWCCCNVGASTPEGYGGYYAWGETSEKSVYDWDTYAYGSWDNCQYIGSDIAGTNYDVAHVRMGTLWRMPSHEQMEELCNTCSRQWTQRNGVSGILLTGRNGGQIFLPAAGVCWGEFYSAGSSGDYWSSSFIPDDGNGAYNLGFNSGNWYWGDCYRYGGLSVRAVRP